MALFYKYFFIIERRLVVIKAIINSIHIEGTPDEILNYQKLIGTEYANILREGAVVIIGTNTKDPSIVNISIY